MPFDGYEMRAKRNIRPLPWSLLRMVPNRRGPKSHVINSTHPHCITAVLFNVATHILCGLDFLL